MHQQPDSGDENWLEEEQYSSEVNRQYEEAERNYTQQRDSSLSAVYGAFQDSATAVALLYRERASNTYPDTAALWLPFQTAAGTVTSLYKESCDGLKRTTEAAGQCGYQRRTRELADWARSRKRRLIRREDLLAYLAGKPPPTHRRSPKPEHTAQVNAQASTQHNVFSNSMVNTVNPLIASLPSNQTSINAASGVVPTEPFNDLLTFKEALVLKPRGPELLAFVANEIARHCKRPASPIDDKMDVCHFNSKRPRFM